MSVNEKSRAMKSIISLDKSSRFGQETWLLNSPHNLYYLQYTLPMNDFLIIDPNEMKGKYVSKRHVEFFGV